MTFLLACTLIVHCVIDLLDYGEYPNYKQETVDVIKQQTYNNDCHICARNCTVILHEL